MSPGKFAEVLPNPGSVMVRLIGWQEEVRQKIVILQWVVSENWCPEEAQNSYPRPTSIVHLAYINQ